MENINLNNELPKADDFFMLGADARDLENIKKHKEVENELDEFYTTGKLKSETLEEKCSRLNRLLDKAIEKIENQYLELDSKNIKINDLKDQLSKTYSEEEVDRILRNFRTDFLPLGQVNDLVFNEWFEQLKNK